MNLDRPVIYLITKGEATDTNFDAARKQILDITAAAVEVNIPFVQLREKQLSGRLLFELTMAAVDIARGSRTRILVNDRADIASAAGASGVHLTERSLPVDVIRRIFPTNFVVGVSTHSLDSTRRAFGDGADYAVFGPIFETPGKGPACGTAELRNVCNAVPDLPVIGIGGIDKTNCAAVLDAGAAGFAAIRSLNEANEMRLIARAIRR